MATSNAPPPIYVANERVLCYHGPLIYEAKVMKVKVFDAEKPNITTGLTGPHYLVHYKGWKQTWDEWTDPSRLLKMTEANLAHQKHLQQTTATTAAHNGGGSAGGSKSGAGKSGGGAGGKDNLSSRTGARKDGTRGTKRARDDDEGTKKPEMKLTIPETLKAKLVDDWEAVTKNNQLLTLPREPSALTVLKEFAEYIKMTQPTHLREPKLVVQTVVDGLQAYFEKAIGTCLLYRFERMQYAAVRHQYYLGSHVVVGKEKPISDIYGAEHLLRMLVNLPQMIALTTLDPESVGIIRDYSNELMVWMVQEKDRIFQKEYESAATGYQNVSRS